MTAENDRPVPPLTSASIILLAAGARWRALVPGVGGLLTLRRLQLHARPQGG
ncbi:hypothetical protein [Nonomuraea sp. CA-141351]|uniref:hypothetical protein n=1 Tax=Nonomuraea sp. CA-141351 TaxID=3239996 RepID=UPI003D8A6D24